MREILESAHGILKRSSLGVEEIVERAFGVDENGSPRKSHWTLYKELNPNDSSGKLGAVDLFLLMQATGDVAPLEVMARLLGYALLDKRTVTPDRSTWAAEHAQDSCDMGAMARLMDEGATPAEVQSAGCRLIKNIEETLVQYGRDYDAGVITRRKAQ
ncbi:MAG: hypothetical protein HDR50_06710 [Desulfovibrio sp.]|uniref:phage regulatory CII family protein n=1 Tax=Desulfovibrio sp. TaxID=885 RepID=UPI001A7B5B33|nr:phage regulatory CII family protein [Desulfovibrio sp.]MBD5417339.1 hypothetical protein [Desulfovibrio sp.]